MFSTALKHIYATQHSGALTSILGNLVLEPFIRYRRIANDVKRRARGRDRSTGIEARASEVQNFLSYSYSYLWAELPFWTGYQLALAVP